MDDFLQKTFQRLLEDTQLGLKRYLYHNFKLSRLTGIVGPRGVGKSTLMLQYIKEHLAADKKVFYFSADAVYFRQTTLLELVNDLYNYEGCRFFFIDEIHKYAHWNQELKNLYDAFPDIHIVYSGSSRLELVKGSYDLSRRARLYDMPGLSFREYLRFSTHAEYDPIVFNDLLDAPQNFTQFSQVESLLGHFRDYLEKGYYPFVFEEPETYQQRLLSIVEKTIYEDIPNYFDLKTQNLHLFQKVLSYLASIPPGEVNTHNIAKNLGVAHQTIFNYLNMLNSVGLIAMVYPAEGGNQGLRKPEKIFFQNTNLLSTMQAFVAKPVDQGTLRELYFVQAMRDAGEKIYYSKQGDYRTQTHVFEVGGRNKHFKQLQGVDKSAFLVKDNILMPQRHILPLYLFGFLY